MSKNTFKLSSLSLPSNFDPLLNITYNINRFYDYLTKVKKISAEEAGASIKELVKLKKCRRKLDLIAERNYTDDAVKAIELFCEYLSHKDKKWTYVYAGAAQSVVELYKYFCGVFKNKNASTQDIGIAMYKFSQAFEELTATKYFDNSNNYEYNYILYFNKDGEIGSREIPGMLDILCDGKIRADIQLLLEI